MDFYDAKNKTWAKTTATKLTVKDIQNIVGETTFTIDGNGLVAFERDLSAAEKSQIDALFSAKKV